MNQNEKDAHITHNDHNYHFHVLNTKSMYVTIHSCCKLKRLIHYYSR